MKRDLLTLIGLLAVTGAASSSDQGDGDLPPWDVGEMQTHLRSALGLDPSTIRLLAWHRDLECPWSTPDQAGNPSAQYYDYALVSAQKEETIFTPKHWVIVLAIRGEHRWHQNGCPHCRSPILHLDRPPRPEDLRDFIPPLWLEPGLLGYKLVAFGILETNWIETFGVEPALAFKPDEAVPDTCEVQSDTSGLH